MTARAASLLLLLAAGGCVRLEYRRDHIESPPGEEDLSSLVPGRSGLADALALLGAPLDVWEGPDGGVVLAYGGLRRSEWVLAASAEIAPHARASFRWTDAAAATPGTVLILDRNLLLVLVEKGLLRDLRERTGPRPPAPVEDGA